MNGMVNGGMTIGSGAGQAYAALRPPQTQGPTLIGEVTDEIAAAAGRAHRAANALREFNDGVLGAEPQAAGGIAGKSPEPYTRSQRIRTETASLHEGIAALEREIERLNRV
jgi:hypothetical protein